MTHKDYQFIAAAFAASRSDVVTKEPDEAHADMLDGIDLVAEHVADALARDNTRFDRQKFLDACGV